MIEDFAGRRILIVEDEVLIALMLQDILEELGCTVVSIASRPAEAFELIAANEGALDAAMLDVNLDGVLSLDVASELDRLGVPFIVTTGYQLAPQLHDLKDRPRLEKPYNDADVKAALQLLRWPEPR